MYYCLLIGDFNQVHNDSCGDCIEDPDKLFHPDTSGSSQTRQHIQPDAIKCYLSGVCVCAHTCVCWYIIYYDTTLIFNILSLKDPS